MVPSVMMNGTTPSRLVSSPLTSPARQPVATQAAIAQPAPQPWSSPPAKTVADSDSAVPTDRSMPPAMMIRVMPRAATAMVDVCTAAVRRRRIDQKLACSPLSSQSAAANNSTMANSGDQRPDGRAPGVAAAAQPGAGRDEQTDVDGQADQREPAQLPAGSPVRWPARECRPPENRRRPGRPCAPSRLPPAGAGTDRRLGGRMFRR